MHNILAADIGGTNSRFAHFSIDDEGVLKMAGLQWFNTTDSDSFASLIDKLQNSPLSLKPGEADIVVIAIAGPVEDGMRSSPPLIPWGIDMSHASRDFGFKRSLLINDFVAQAWACLSHIGKAVELILPGNAVVDAAIAVIGAGTGLGKAVLISDGKGGRIVVPSEGGHASFPFESGQEFEFQSFLMKERKERYITCNTVVSGRGLSYIHSFLTGERLEPHEIAPRLSECPLTLEWAARFYGRVCRNFALEVFSSGGMYITGGVAAKIPELVRHKAFSGEFRSSDTLSKLLEKIPVYLIADENSGLWGAAVYAWQKLKEARP